MTEARTRLVIELSTDNARRNAQAMSDALRQTAQSGDQASQSVNSLGRYFINSSGAVVGATGRFVSASNAARDLGISVNQLNTTLPRYQGVANGAGQASQSLGSAFNSLNSNALNLVKTFGAYITISEAIARSDMYTGLQNRLKLVTHSQTELSQAMNDTFNIAQATGARWDSTAQVYQRFADNAKTLGINMKHTAQLTETVSKAISISGGSATSAEAALTQFGQSLASGVFRGEEFNSVAEQAPGLLKALASGLDVNIGQLRKMANAGQLTGDVLVKALDNSKESVDQLFGKTDFTIGQSFTMLSNQVTKFIGESNKGTGAASTLASSIQALANNFNLAANTTITAFTGILTALLVKQSIALGVTVTGWYAETAAMVASNGVRATSIALCRTLSTALLGPVGLGLAAAGAAASFLIMRDNTDEANKKLEEQTAVAYQTKKELLALQGVQKQGAVDDLKTAFEAQNKAVKQAGYLFNAHIIDLQNMYRSSVEVVDISNQVRNGTMSQADAIKKLNDLKFITPDQLKQLKQDNENYNEKTSIAKKCAEALEVFGIKTELAGNKAQNAIVPIASNTQALNDNATAAGAAANAMNKFWESQRTDAVQAVYKNGLLDKGYTAEQANAIWKGQESKGMESVLTQQDIDNILETVRLTENLKAHEKEITDEKNKQAKLAEKQLKTLQVSAQVQANAQKYNFAGLEQKYGLTSGLLTSTHAIETGNTGKTNQLNKSSGALGGFQLMLGTAKQYGVTDRTNLAQSAEGAAKYFQYLLKKFNGNLEKSVRAYHAGEGNVQRGTNLGKFNNDYWAKTQSYLGGLSGYNGSKKDFSSSLADQIKLIQKAQEETKKLKEQYDTADTKRENDHIERMADLQKHGLTEQMKQEEINYQAQKNLSKLQREYDLNGFKMTEDEKLTYSVNIKKAEAYADTKLGKIEKQLAIEAIDEKYGEELAQIEIAKKERLLAAEEIFKTESELVIARYQLEADKIKLMHISDEERLKLQESNNVKIFRELNKDHNAVGQIGRSAQLDILQKKNPNAYAQYDLQNQYEVDQDGLSKAYDNQIGALNEKDFKDEGDRYQQLLEADEQYLQAKQALDEKYAEKEKELRFTQLQMNLSYGEQTFGSVTSMMSDAFGKQSAAYKAAFTVQKAFAIASATLAMQQNIAEASKIGFPYNIPMIAAAMAQGASIVSNVSAIATEGFSEGGYTGHGGKYDVAGVVHKGEVVFSQSDIARLGGVGSVEDIRTGRKRGYADGGLVGDIPPDILNQVNVSSTPQKEEANVTPQNIHIFNHMNHEDMLKQALASPSGTRVLINWMNENSTAVRNVAR
ncbi:tape measure protein [Acinetobacter sp. HY1485]|uniref:tape measure protein n=1 Tax=Acinetobacter sp. HY1485 TaxID=2970918 RepID=UPI0022B9782F|nr:tape measure protein [Acinetobacter sp. HY1485]